MLHEHDKYSLYLIFSANHRFLQSHPQTGNWFLEADQLHLSQKFSSSQNVTF